MGQYFRGCIITGKYHFSNTPVQFCPWDWGNGAKLMEHSYERNTMAKCFAYQLAIESEENPVRAAWMGDYADEHLFTAGHDPEMVDAYNDPKRFEALAIMYVKAWCLNAGDDDMREAVFNVKHPDDYKDLESEYDTPIYVADLDKKEYILTYPNDPKDWAVSRLNLLLTAFNGAGGSYYGSNMDMVGRWAGDRLIAELLGGFPEPDDTWFRQRLEKQGYRLDDFTKLDIEFEEEM